jgi:hypothetical protein
METKPKQEKRICVEYKGGNLILQPGHKVFEINLNTGKVKEHPIRRKFTLFFWRKPVYQLDYHEHLLHVPAYDLYKAKLQFRTLLRKTDIKVC